MKNNGPCVFPPRNRTTVSDRFRNSRRLMPKRGPTKSAQRFVSCVRTTPDSDRCAFPTAWKDRGGPIQLFGPRRSPRTSPFSLFPQNCTRQSDRRPARPFAKRRRQTGQEEAFTRTLTHTRNRPQGAARPMPPNNNTTAALSAAAALAVGGAGVWTSQAAAAVALLFEALTHPEAGAEVAESLLAT